MRNSSLSANSIRNAIIRQFFYDELQYLNVIENLKNEEENENVKFAVYDSLNELSGNSYIKMFSVNKELLQSILKLLPWGSNNMRLKCRQS